MNYTFDGTLIVHPDKIVSGELIEKFERCNYFVEGDRDAENRLHAIYAVDANPRFCPPFYRDTKKVTWKEESSFFYLCLAYINEEGLTNKRSVCVNFSFATIGSLYVCFYYPSGRYCDFTAIEHWLDTFYPKQTTDGRKARTDICNFHFVLNAIDNADKEN